jgi:hypothetical protein
MKGVFTRAKWNERGIYTSEKHEHEKQTAYKYEQIL